MKTLHKHIIEKLVINKDFKKVKVYDELYLNADNIFILFFVNRKKFITFDIFPVNVKTFTINNNEYVLDGNDKSNQGSWVLTGNREYNNDVVSEIVEENKNSYELAYAFILLPLSYIKETMDYKTIFNKICEKRINISEFANIFDFEIKNILNELSDENDIRVVFDKEKVKFLCSLVKKNNK